MLIESQIMLIAKIDHIILIVHDQGSLVCSDCDGAGLTRPLEATCFDSFQPNIKHAKFPNSLPLPCLAGCQRPITEGRMQALSQVRCEL